MGVESGLGLRLSIFSASSFNRGREGGRNTHIKMTNVLVGNF